MTWGKESHKPIEKMELLHGTEFLRTTGDADVRITIDQHEFARDNPVLASGSIPLVRSDLQHFAPFSSYPPAAFRCIVSATKIVHIS